MLVGRHTAVPVSFNPPSLRRDDESVRAQLENPALAYQPPRSSDAAASPAGDGGPVRLTAAQISEQLDAFLLASGALVRVNDGGRDHGQIRAFNNRSFDPAKVVPTVIVRNEDYGRISRLLADKTAVELEFNVVNHVYPEGKTSYNAIAEIKGTDKADEVVMLGGHLDSWHAATGATDNAIGCAVMMEAARILKAIGVKPRRTIRVALWSGEEQGLLGSKAYVKEHFGTAEAPKAEFEKFNGYFNVDSGTGRIRSASIFGPPAAGGGAARGVRAVRGLRRARRRRDAQPAQRRHRQHVVQRSGPARHRPRPGSDRVSELHLAHQPRHLRAHRRRRREALGDGDRGGGVSRGDARRDAAALHEGPDAGVISADASGAGGADDEPVGSR